MMNKTLLNAFIAIALLLPVNMQAYFVETSNEAESNTPEQDENFLVTLGQTTKELFSFLTEDLSVTEEEQSVTPAVADAAENDTPEEINNETKEEPKDIKVLLEEWQQTLPVYEEDTNQTQFIQTIAPAAVLISDYYDIYPSVMIAQAALESSWGQSDLAQSYNNLMGTKGTWNGESVTVRTREDVDGSSVYIDAGFSVYDSWAASLHRYGHLMKNGLEWDNDFYHGTWRENTESYQDATAWLQGRYATDSAIATKLNQTIQSFQLDQYDAVEGLDKSLDELLAEMTVEMNEENI